MPDASPYDTYTSPLATRNASPEMLRLWSARHKFNTWRKIWLAVAEAQHEITVRDRGAREGRATAPSGASAGALQPLVTSEQLEELRAVVNRPGGITDAEIRAAEKYERELRHDVMAHVHALGDSCPKAKGIIHLGMTSQDVVCNADILILRASARLIEVKVARVQDALATQAERWKTLPTLGFTHYQPAQPLTVGRRIAIWAYDLDAGSGVLWHHFRGLRGATGTQASFLALLDNSHAQVERLELRFLFHLFNEIDDPGLFADDRAQFEDELADGGIANPDHDVPGIAGSLRNFRHVLSGQTYRRVDDAEMLADLAKVACVLHKIATDIRLLSNRKELDEPFETNQIGSSAMPYKRNPMRCERICGLTRFVMNLVGNAYDTAATQWLERTLDDSSNRRLSLPEAFLALDGALDLMHNVASGLVVHEAMVKKNLMAELPFMATENILMACVKAGGDRQHYHELIRVHAQAAGTRVKQEGLDNDLLDRLQGDNAFHPPALKSELDWNGLLDPMKYIGRSVEQTERFIKEVVEPLREQYGDAIARLNESDGGGGPRV